MIRLKHFVQHYCDYYMEQLWRPGSGIFRTLFYLGVFRSRFQILCECACRLLGWFLTSSAKFLLLGRLLVHLGSIVSSSCCSDTPLSCSPCVLSSFIF